jgi:hypothetical protein
MRTIGCSPRRRSDAARIGALLVTGDPSDFIRLAGYLPVSVRSFDEFRKEI